MDRKEILDENEKLKKENRELKRIIEIQEAKQENIRLQNENNELKNIIDEETCKKSYESSPDEEAQIISLLKRSSKRVKVLEALEYDNKIFHLYNHNLVTLKYVVDVIKKAGFDIKVLSEENFKETIVKYSKEKNENLSALVNDFDTSNLSLDYNYTVNIKSDFTQKILKQLGFTWAKIDDKYITKIINYMKDVDFI